jgi:hypothetical protein
MSLVIVPVCGPVRLPHRCLPLSASCTKRFFEQVSDILEMVWDDRSLRGANTRKLRCGNCGPL